MKFSLFALARFFSCDCELIFVKFLKTVSIVTSNQRLDFYGDLDPGHTFGRNIPIQEKVIERRLN